MIPVDQDLFGPEEGNCVAACVASLLELPLADVPNICAASSGPPEQWLERLNAWLRRYGLVAVLLDTADFFDWSWFGGAWCIVSGKSERGLLHATVWRDGQLVHDPHPSKSGICAPESIVIFVALDPASERKLCSLLNARTTERYSAWKERNR